MKIKIGTTISYNVRMARHELDIDTSEDIEHNGAERDKVHSPGPKRCASPSQ
jgi:hypothetical protein